MYLVLKFGFSEAQIYVYVYVHMYMYIYVYVYIDIHTSKTYKGILVQGHVTIRINSSVLKSTLETSKI